MAEAAHRTYNATIYHPVKHALILRRMTEQTGPQKLRLCETPVFLSRELFGTIVKTGKELIHQALDPGTLHKTARYIPPEFDAHNCRAMPDFAVVDFAIARDADGHLCGKLIEMQGVGSFFGLQYYLSREFSEVYGLRGVASYLPGVADEQFFAKLRGTIVGKHDPRHVVLMDVNPNDQLTAPDFKVFERELGIRAVAVDDIFKFGKNLYYIADRRLVRIERIYNRVMNEEFTRLCLSQKTRFNFSDDLDVEWVGHPHWYYLISKATLPLLDHPASPQAWFLDEMREYPDDLQNYVLKPLFAYGGSGVKIGVVKSDLDAVPADRRREYILMTRVNYADYIENCDGKRSTAEVRVMYICTRNKIVPMILMGRVSHGNSNSMTSAAFEAGEEWVGIAPVMAVAASGLRRRATANTGTITCRGAA